MCSTVTSVWDFSKNVIDGSGLISFFKMLLECVFYVKYLHIHVLVCCCFCDMHKRRKKVRYTSIFWVYPGPLWSSSILFSSVTAKIKAIEAKLKMMAENPDAEYPAAPVYSYFKPPDKKRTTPYSRTAWKSRRWWLRIIVAAKANWSLYLKSSAFVLCRCEWYFPTEHNHMLTFGNITFLDVSWMFLPWSMCGIEHHPE